MDQNYWSRSQCYPWRVNQLGGRYINGKPLPFETRMQILYCAKNGIRPCDISRHMKITHGCISKLLAKFKRTGSMVPGSTRHETAFYELQRRQRFLANKKEALPVQCNNESAQRHLNQSHILEEKQATRRPYKHSIDEILNKSDDVGCEKEGNVSERKSSYNTHVSTFTDIITDSTNYFSPMPRLNVVDKCQRKSGQRTHFTRDQFKVLYDEFTVNKYPCLEERQHLATKLGVKESKIRIWFSNRRAKCKQTMKEQQDNIMRFQTEPPSAECLSPYCKIIHG